MSKKTTDETLGREAVKEYLQQYHTAVGKKRILEERHRVLSKLHNGILIGGHHKIFFHLEEI